MTTAKFYADTVGSFMRPPSILEANEKFEKKEINEEQIQKIQDDEIKLLVEKQVKAGLKIVSDGEFRREAYWYDFWVGFHGVRGEHKFPVSNAALAPLKEAVEAAEAGKPSRFSIRTPYVFEKIVFNPDHPEFRAFDYLKSVTPANIIPKVIIPAPNFLRVFRGKGDEFPPAYPNKDAFYADVSDVLHQAILEFYKRGARVIQIDDPTFFIFAFTIGSTVEEQRAVCQDLIASSIQLLKPALANLPADLKIAIHVCRANGENWWPVPYGYEDSLHYFAALQPDYVLLEYDDARSGTFEVLKKYAAALPKTQFFLGIITTKNAVVEDEAEVEKKLKEAAAEVGGLDRVGLCPQCGFGTFNKYVQPTSVDAQWGKLNLLGAIQKKLWGI